MSQLLIATKQRSASVSLPDLSKEEVQQFVSIADAIRYLIKKYPEASNGSIARLVSKYHTKEVRVQWVYNVRHQILKSK